MLIKIIVIEKIGKNRKTEFDRIKYTMASAGNPDADKMSLFKIIK
jgi:hypothetical protein